MFVVGARQGTHSFTHMHEWLFEVHEMWGAWLCMQKWKCVLRQIYIVCICVYMCMCIYVYVYICVCVNLSISQKQNIIFSWDKKLYIKDCFMAKKIVL